MDDRARRRLATAPLFGVITVLSAALALGLAGDLAWLFVAVTWVTLAFLFARSLRRRSPREQRQDAAPPVG